MGRKAGMPQNFNFISGISRQASKFETFFVELPSYPANIILALFRVEGVAASAYQADKL